MTKLKEQNGKHYQKCAVVMLPTEKEVKTKLHLLINHITNSLSKSYLRDSSDITNMNFVVCKPQHIYITSDEPIIEGDWYIKDNEIHQKLYGKTVIPSDARKIIATTDISLGLPTPSFEFISAYITAYNKGEQIKDVMIEYEDYSIAFSVVA